MVVLCIILGLSSPNNTTALRTQNLVRLDNPKHKYFLRKVH